MSCSYYISRCKWNIVGVCGLVVSLVFFGRTGARSAVACICNITRELGICFEPMAAARRLSKASPSGFYERSSQQPCVNFSFAPSGLSHFLLRPHGLRHGLYSVAASRLFRLHQRCRTGCGSKFPHAIRDVSFQNGKRRPHLLLEQLGFIVRGRISGSDWFAPRRGGRSWCRA